MAKPNYKFDKRQRDMARLKKQEEKRQKKLAKKAAETAGEPGAAPPADELIPH